MLNTLRIDYIVSLMLLFLLQTPLKAEESSTSEQQQEQPSLQDVIDEVTDSEQPAPSQPIPLPTTATRNGKQKIFDNAVDFANMIDRFFGENEELESAGYDYLRLVSSVKWQQGESLEFRPHVKAKVHLPRIDKKFSILFDGDEDIYQGQSEQNQINDLIANQDQKRTAAAINYESDLYDNSKFDTRLGLDSKLVPFALIKHTYSAFEDQNKNFKNFNSIFWRERYGVGVNLRTEFNQIINTQNLFRWKYSILRAEKSDGNEWRNTFSILQHNSKQSWFSYDFDVAGRSAYQFDIEYYRLGVRYRQQMPTKWLYFEIEPELLWLRTPETLERELVPGITLRFEIQFED